MTVKKRGNGILIICTFEHKRNPNYGRTKSFHCLLSSGIDNPIFIAINRLVAKKLKQDENKNNPIRYPCQVANGFACPYDDKSSNAKFDVKDLFELANIAFAVEIAVAVTKRDTSAIQIKNKQDLYQSLTNREVFAPILEQGHDYLI